MQPKAAAAIVPITQDAEQKQKQGEEAIGCATHITSLAGANRRE